MVSTKLVPVHVYDVLIFTGTYPPLPSLDSIDFSLLREEVNSNQYSLHSWLWFFFYIHFLSKTWFSSIMPFVYFRMSGPCFSTTFSHSMMWSEVQWQNCFLVKASTPNLALTRYLIPSCENLLEQYLKNIKFSFDVHYAVIFIPWYVKCFLSTNHDDGIE